jgi:hypothetical protein
MRGCVAGFSGECSSLSATAAASGGILNKRRFWVTGWLGSVSKKGRYVVWMRPAVEKRALRCLDAACGTGEGVYDLARLLLESTGITADWQVDGVTLEPLELFSAAHGYFPHDPERQVAFRKRVAPLLEMGLAERISFTQGDVTVGSNPVGSGYTVIVCNGLLGGPLLSQGRQLAVAVANLAAMLEPGGILLAADRFHGGWRKRISRGALGDILAGCGLRPLSVEDGIAGVRPMD